MTRKLLPAALALTALAISPMTLAASAKVKIKDFSFHPAKITVAPGTTVVWTNDDSVPHTVTAANGAYNSGELDQGMTFSHTFAKAGDFKYHCSFHGGMKGQVVVR